MVNIDIEAHFHGGPMDGETRTVWIGQRIYPIFDDVSGNHGEYVRSDDLSDGRFEWRPR